MTPKKKAKGQLVVLSAPSGTGKSTVIVELLAQREMFFSVSYTTRNPRVGEVPGVSYNYVTKQEFQRMIDADELLEYTEYVDNFYGTSRKIIQEKLDAGIDVLLEIEVDGAAKVRQRCPDAIFIFMIPPSFEELSRRLRARATDDEAVIAERLAKAREEYKEIPKYDYLVINDKVTNAVQEIEAILTAAECRVMNRKYFVEGDKML